LSYRSVNRSWVLALYDVLRSQGFDVFLDQFVLQVGMSLSDSLRDNLRASAGAVLVWSRAAADSEWVQAELKQMQRLREKNPRFQYVIAVLDDAEVPFLEQDDKVVRFAEQPEGPRGRELLELLYGAIGKPLPPDAVRWLTTLEERTRDLLVTIQSDAERATEDAVQSLVALAESSEPALHATPLPLCLAAERLIGIDRPAEALTLLQTACARFPKALRPQQLCGLALRRLERVDEAQQVLGRLYERGHRDPETLGIWAATWAQRYAREKRRIHLERSQLLYQEAFALTPSDSYVGINAASKSALLGNVDEARRTAAQVLELVKTVRTAADGSDYWLTATHAEARLLLDEDKTAIRLYRTAVVKHSARAGDIASTRDQALALAGALALPEETRQALREAFSTDQP